MKILLVEDDRIAADILSQELTAHRYSVEIATDGQIGLELAQTFPYDLLLVDIMLPYLNGIDLCRQLRSRGLQMPILLLSARDQIGDRVMGLEAGADDYLVKPYEYSELMARIQALLRRGSATLPTVLTWEKLQLDPNACQVTYNEKRVHLTPKEYGILELFLRNPQRTFSRSAILDRIWLSGEYPQEEAVSTQIKGLRQKLKTAGLMANLIETVYGLGYRLKVPPSAEYQPHRASKRQAEAKVQAVVRQMQNNFKENFDSQLILFEQAIAQLATDTLDEQLRSAALAEAHRLIGSLGSLGLLPGSAIARRIEQLLRGTVLGKLEGQQLAEWVENLKQAVEEPPSPAIEPQPQLASRRLLIVDDDCILTERLKHEAIAWGFQVEIATDPAAARFLMATSVPDAIALDLTFPQTAESGLTLLAELTQQAPDIPVLVMTGRNQLSDRVAVARLGRHTFLEKPLHPKEILTAVVQELDRHQKAEAKILILDDDPTVLAALVNLLEPWGFQVRTLSDPQQFWQILEACTPDLLILDIEMPGFSGIELCQVVRSDPRWTLLPVIFLSSHLSAEMIYQVFAVGADDYVQKPIVGPELIARILNRLERTRILRRFAELERAMPRCANLKDG